MSDKPTIEEHAKIMEDAWHSAEEQNIIFSRTISEQQAELTRLKQAVRSGVQAVNDRDETIERLRSIIARLAPFLQEDLNNYITDDYRKAIYDALLEVSCDDPIPSVSDTESVEK